MSKGSGRLGIIAAFLFIGGSRIAAKEYSTGIGIMKGGCGKL